MKSSTIWNLPCLHFLGRCQQRAAQTANVFPLFWAGSGLDLCFTGSELHLLLEADFAEFEPWIAVELNHAFLLRMPLSRGEQELCLFRGMTPGVPKQVRIWKETQPFMDDPRHHLWLKGLRWDGGEFQPVPKSAYRLEFIGDSLTSGEGVIGAFQETDWVPPLFSASRTWAKQCADLVEADFRLISQSGWGIRSGWDNNPRHTLPGIYGQVCAPALGRVNQTMGAQDPHDFGKWQPDAILINLGTNDAGAMGNPAWEGPDGQSFQQTRDAQGLALLENAALDFLKCLREHNPSAKLVWVYGMLGDALRPQLEHAVERFCAEADKNAYYLPLPNVRPETMGSRQHPGPVCHQEAAQTAADFLKTILQ